VTTRGPSRRSSKLPYEGPESSPRDNVPEGDRLSGAFPRNLGADELPDTGDPEADREAQRWRQGETGGRWVT
jgi:hypothetical protein